MREQTTGEPPLVVVAMTTCNGERFIGEQLASIAEQSVQPAALVVSDDASTDGTLAIVDAFAATVSFEVHTVTVRRRTGFHANSDRALSRAAQLGDVVVPCDHDDVWPPGKLAAIQAVFQARPEVTMWFSDAELIDVEGKSLGTRLWPLVSLDFTARAELEAGGGLRRLLHWSTVAGGTSAVRADIIQHVTPIPLVTREGKIEFFPDGWVAAIARLLGEIVTDDRPLLLYRRHREQMSARHARPPIGGTVQRAQVLAREHAAVACVLERIGRDRQAPWIPRLKNELLELEAFLAVRRQPRGSEGRSRSIADQLLRGSYHRFARGVRTAIFDLVAPQAGHRGGDRAAR